jgi:dCMP deaminase
VKQYHSMCQNNCDDGCASCEIQVTTESQKASTFKGHPYWKAADDRARGLYPNWHIDDFLYTKQMPSGVVDYGYDSIQPIALPKETEVTGPREVPSRDEYFIGMLPAIAARSKDPRNQVSAVIVGTAGEILSTGFNGFPANVKETPERWDRASGAKYKWVLCAEKNGITNAARVGTAIAFSTMYVSFLPCVSCAAMIVNANILRVVVDAANHSKVTSPRWEEDRPIVEAMFNEAGVDLIMFGGEE